jgi:hypothetical protein
MILVLNAEGRFSRSQYVKDAQEQKGSSKEV